MVHPSGVFTLRYNKARLSDSIVQGVTAFAFVYALTIIFIAMLLAIIGLDPVTSLSGAITSVANVDPGLGSIIVSYWQLLDTARRSKVDFEPWNADGTLRDPHYRGRFVSLFLAYLTSPNFPTLTSKLFRFLFLNDDYEIGIFCERD